MLPVYVAATRPGDGLVWLAWVAFAVGIAASPSNWPQTQMHRFVAAKRRGSAAGAVMETGLWPGRGTRELFRRGRVLVLAGAVRHLGVPAMRGGCSSEWR